MSYPFVRAYYDYGRRRGPTLALVIHMAEGGGTVGFLSRPQSRGVSVHYVIERSGRIVQMLDEDRASGSINPNDLRTTEGPPPFGRSAADAVLEERWVGDPNSAVLSVEVEGYAREGPNPAQHAALVRLANDVRSRYPRIGLLGHRDFQDYKRCPGPYIPWAAMGGHGPAESSLAIYIETTQAGTLTIKAGDTVRGYSLSGERPIVAKTWEPRDTDSAARYDAILHATNNQSPTPLLRVTSGFFEGLYVPTSQVVEQADPPAPPPTATYPVTVGGKPAGSVTLP